MNLPAVGTDPRTADSLPLPRPLSQPALPGAPPEPKFELFASNYHVNFSQPELILNGVYPGHCPSCKPSIS